MTTGKWLKKWEVNSSSGNGKYIVSLSEKGVWGCSCPVWKFKRQECHHIKQIKLTDPKPNQKPKERPEYILARVKKPILKEEENKLLIPLVAVGDIWMEATICFYMLKYGYSWSEIKEKRHLPESWTRKAVLNYIEEYGENEYKEA